MINALNAPVEAAWQDAEQAAQAAAAIPARIRLGDLSPDMMRWKPRSSRSPTPSEWPPITPRPPGPHPRRIYTPAGDKAYALIREAPVASGDIIPGYGELLARLDPLTALRRTRALAALCDQLTHARARYPGTDLVLRYQIKDHTGTA